METVEKSPENGTMCWNMSWLLNTATLFVG